MKIARIFAIVLTCFIISGCSRKKTDQQSDEQSQDIEQTTDTTYVDEKYYETIEDSGASEELKDSKLSASKIEMVQTENGYFKVTLPDGWNKIDTKEVSDTADLAFKNSSNDGFFMVLSEEKEGFSNFDAFKSSVDLTELGEVTSEETSEIDYNGLKGERKVFTAKKDNLDIFYIYDLLEGTDYYLQCVSWTLNSNKETNEADLKQIMTSLIELKE